MTRAIAIALLASAAWAQLPGLPGGSKPDDRKAVDTLGRSTPRGALTGFLRAAQQGRWRTAAQYLEVSESVREGRGILLAQQLELVLDAGFKQPLSVVSDRIEGASDDGLSPNRDRAGDIVVDDNSVDLILTRVMDRESGEIWLIAAETLARVPSLAARVTGSGWIDSVPAPLQERFLGVAWWQWIGMLAGFGVAFGVALILVRLTRRFLTGLGVDGSHVPWPVVTLLALALHTVLVNWLALPLLSRSYYWRAVGIVALAAFAALINRILDTLMERWRARVVAEGLLATGSWIVLGRRMLKAVVWAVASIAILATLGFNMSAALAGLGIGGLALAFAAQKTLENLFGGVSIASDEVIRVGDTLRLGPTIGTVIDIGLRSTRIRTLDRTELSIPNGSLANMNIENLSLRDKHWFQTVLNLSYDTTPDQLRSVLAAVRKLLEGDPRIDKTEALRVRMTGFAESAISIEIFCYIATRDWNEFMAIREDLLLRIMDIVEGAGSNFAFPSRTVYLKRGDDLDFKSAEQSAE